MMSTLLQNVGDWHTHNYRCKHATGEIDEYIIHAIRKRLAIIGLSDHFPISYASEDNSLRLQKFAMAFNEVEEYLAEAKRLKAYYKNKIDVKIGFEVGYLEGKEAQYFNRITSLNGSIDYIIGSVHTVKLEGKYWGLKNEDLENIIKKYGAHVVYAKYFETVRKMLLSEKFELDIIGHLDFIKNGKESPQLNDFILEKIYELIPYIKERDVVVEINTQGMRNGYKKLYPCKKVVRMLYDHDIPVLLSSDAHSPGDVGFGFTEVMNYIKELGYASVIGFNKRKKVSYGVN
ncbi:MAG: putative Histidinol-phosphatase [Promethearchaeota archaeon]|nr:MAG: putative Histidinol-phosphatase [Candidatus Lokiarchaeota archaeon]